MSAPTDPVDFSAPGAQEPQPSPTKPADKEEEKAVVPTPLSPPSDEYLRQEERNDLERRVMRYCLFAVMMFFAIFFLSCGLFFALKVGDGLLLAKQSIVTVLTSTSPDVSHCVIPVKCVPGPSRGITEAVANLNADWFSASSLIMLVAFILGVGLTLILTLLKSAFRHPTDNTSKDESNQTSLELATPLSELISVIASYLKDKFSK
ncbi:hypothetical protein SPG90_20745 (plasmid) [Enterobacter sp. D2]|uniref:hypothetical protein n=1 Tax=Enterobacter sp. D2 TaxID=3102784 RepID=UPI002ACA26C7|nr:hypothetical protein [Enterobacter sp. D2]MDZ5730932.1 hypothetical protein [Enterobacter sp. D2]